jgi:hypothetical protein
MPRSGGIRARRASPPRVVAGLSRCAFDKDRYYKQKNT